MFVLAHCLLSVKFEPKVIFFVVIFFLFLNIFFLFPLYYCYFCCLFFVSLLIHFVSLFFIRLIKSKVYSLTLREFISFSLFSSVVAATRSFCLKRLKRCHYWVLNTKHVINVKTFMQFSLTHWTFSSISIRNFFFLFLFFILIGSHSNLFNSIWKGNTLHMFRIYFGFLLIGLLIIIRSQTIQIKKNKIFSVFFSGEKKLLFCVVRRHNIDMTHTPPPKHKS